MPRRLRYPVFAVAALGALSGCGGGSSSGRDGTDRDDFQFRSDRAGGRIDDADLVVQQCDRVFGLVDRLGRHFRLGDPRGS